MRTAAIALCFVLAGPGLASAQQQAAPIVTELAGGQVIASGYALKSTTGAIDIPFGTTFADRPNVVVSPLWVAEVGGIETITRVNRDRFQVTSKNAANNYFVSWVAVGRR